MERSFVSAWMVLAWMFCGLERCWAKTEELKIVDTLLSQYDRRATPSNLFDNATTVNCELYIRSFGFKDPSSMDYLVDLYLRQTWQDKRLNHVNITQPLDLNDPKLVRAIWKPEVYFPNAKDASFEYVTVPNLLVRIKPKGSILYMLRLKLVFACMMELSKFPLDTQVCTMEIASFSKTVRELALQWKSELPILIYRRLRMPQFKITKVVATRCQESFQIGNYSCLLVEFHMRRSVGYHLVQSYLPTMLFVVISWLSFWMDVESLLPRTSLGITTLLTVSSKSSALQGGVPQVSYVKAIDVWMGTCTAFVFCSLLELTLINCLWRKQRLLVVARSDPHVRSSTTTSFITSANVSRKATDEGPIFQEEDMSTDVVEVRRGSPPRLSDLPAALTEGLFGQLKPSTVCDPNKLVARSIDAWCRVIFPAAYITFIAGYWSYYMY